VDHAFSNNFHIQKLTTQLLRLDFKLNKPSTTSNTVYHTRTTSTTLADISKTMYVSLNLLISPVKIKDVKRLSINR